MDPRYELKLYRDRRRDPLTEATGNIKRHVVQVEVMILAVILFLALLGLQPALATFVSSDISLLFPLVFLAIIPLFVQVINPESSLRSRLVFGLSGAGLGGMIGGGVAGVATGVAGAPVGTLIGAPMGFVIGFVAGPYIDGTHKKVLTQGEAREYLVKQQSRYPALSLEAIVNATSGRNLEAMYDMDDTDTTSDPCWVEMFLSDGVPKCTKDEVIRWLKSECWKKSTIPKKLSEKDLE